MVIAVIKSQIRKTKLSRPRIDHMHVSEFQSKLITRDILDNFLDPSVVSSIRYECVDHGVQIVEE